MPRRSLRTRSVKRKNICTPGSRSIIHYYRYPKSGQARCSACGAKLSGIPKLVPSKMANTAKSNKRPNRPYGGYLCPRCLSSRIRAKVCEETKAPEKAKKQK